MLNFMFTLNFEQNIIICLLCDRGFLWRQAHNKGLCFHYIYLVLDSPKHHPADSYKMHQIKYANDSIFGLRLTY